MYYVYLIQSLNFPTQKYVGYTSNLDQRLAIHNSGGSVHTAKYRPWKLILYLAFTDEKKALAFERYLKSGAGNAFAAKRFW